LWQYDSIQTLQRNWAPLPPKNLDIREYRPHNDGESTPIPNILFRSGLSMHWCHFPPWNQVWPIIHPDFLTLFTEGSVLNVSTFTLLPHQLMGHSEGHLLQCFLYIQLHIVFFMWLLVEMAIIHYHWCWYNFTLKEGWWPCYSTIFPGQLFIISSILRLSLCIRVSPIMLYTLFSHSECPHVCGNPVHNNHLARLINCFHIASYPT